MLTAYRTALSTPGAKAFTTSGFIARLPIAMIGLGIVLMVSTLTGSYARAAVISAAFQVSAAVGSIYTSRWADRIGQARIVLPLALVHAAALIALAALIETGAPLVASGLAAVLAGLAQPAIGSLVRARWANALQGADAAPTLRSGFAIESILDELIFTLGPMLAAFLAFSVALPLPLVAAAVLVVIGSWTLAAQRASQPPAHGHRARHRSALLHPGIAIVFCAALGTGAVFGSFEVSVVAFTREHGRPEFSGLVLALWSVGAILGGLAYGARHLHASLAKQAIALGIVSACALVPMPFLGTLGWLGALTVVAGLTTAPALIVMFSLTARLAPSALLTEALAWVNSGLALGFSAGNVLAGVIVDAHGTSAAFTVPVAMALAATAAYALGRRPLGRALEQAHASAGLQQPGAISL